MSCCSTIYRSVIRPYKRINSKKGKQETAYNSVASLLTYARIQNSQKCRAAQLSPYCKHGEWQCHARDNDDQEDEEQAVVM